MEPKMEPKGENKSANDGIKEVLDDLQAKRTSESKNINYRDLLDKLEKNLMKKLDEVAESIKTKNK
jgi:hypothetical protein